MPRGRPASLSKSLGGAKRGIDNVAPEWHESYYPTAAPSSSSSSLSAAINKRRNDDGGGHGQKKARTSISGARQQPEKRLKRIRNCEGICRVNTRSGSTAGGLCAGGENGVVCLRIVHRSADVEKFWTVILTPSRLCRVLVQPARTQSRNEPIESGSKGSFAWRATGPD